MSSCTILSVEDNEDEFMLLKFACEEAQVSFCLQHVGNGTLALAYLEGTHEYADRARFPMPGLVLLDLKMPGKSGFEVLEWMRGKEHLQYLPVVVFTSSVHEPDRLRALELGARDFRVKPVSFDELQDFARGLDRLLAEGGTPQL